MPKLSNLTYKDVTRRLKKLWFKFHRQGKWSHELRVRDIDKEAVPISKHRSKIFKLGTMKAILKEINISEQDFLK